MTIMIHREEQLLEEFRNLSIEVSVTPKSLKVSALIIRNEMEDHIIEATPRDPYKEVKELMKIGKAIDFKFIEK